MYLFDVNFASPHSIMTAALKTGGLAFSDATRRRLEGAEAFAISAMMQPGYKRLKALWSTLSPTSCSDGTYTPEKEAFEEPPSTIAANAYDAAVALTLAMQEANQHMNFNPVASGNAIRGYLRNQKFEGASGWLQFDSWGDRNISGQELVFSQFVLDDSHDFGIATQPMLFAGEASPCMSPASNLISPPARPSTPRPHRANRRTDLCGTACNASGQATYHRWEVPLQPLIPNSERIYGGGSKVPPKDAIAEAIKQRKAEELAGTIALIIALTVGIVRPSRSRRDHA